jgi:hypothetical protein
MARLDMRRTVLLGLGAWALAASILIAHATPSRAPPPAVADTPEAGPRAAGCEPVYLAEGATPIMAFTVWCWDEYGQPRIPAPAGRH